MNKEKIIKQKININETLNIPIDKKEIVALKVILDTLSAHHITKTPNFNIQVNIDIKV